MSAKTKKWNQANSEWDRIEKKAMRRLDHAHKTIADDDKAGWRKFFEEEIRLYKEVEKPEINRLYKIMEREDL